MVAWRERGVEGRVEPVGDPGEGVKVSSWLIKHVVVKCVNGARMQI